MAATLRSHTPLLAFTMSLAAIYGVAVVIVSRLAQLDNPRLIAGALTIDLTLLVPLLYYLLLVRWRGWPAVTILPVFLGSVALAHWLIPETERQVLGVISYAAGVAELTIVGFVVVKLVQVRRSYRRHASSGLDVHTALRESARAILGPVAGNVLAYEVAVFYYAMMGWRRVPDSGPEWFTGHRESGYGALAVGLMIAAGIEMVAVHALVWLWSPAVAWVLTAISVYALVWLIGDTQAVRQRPIRVSRDTLHLRLGLRWMLEVPRDSIERVVALDEHAPSRPESGYLKAILLGTPNRRIELKQAVEASGPYGLTRHVTTIDLRVDEPARFDAALDAWR